MTKGAKLEGVPRLEELPDGWVIIKNATGAPKGWLWASNGKSRLGSDYEHALVRDRRWDR